MWPLLYCDVVYFRLLCETVLGYDIEKKDFWVSSVKCVTVCIMLGIRTRLDFKDTSVSQPICSLMLPSAVGSYKNKNIWYDTDQICELAANISTANIAKTSSVSIGCCFPIHSRLWKIFFLLFLPWALSSHEQQVYGLTDSGLCFKWAESEIFFKTNKMLCCHGKWFCYWQVLPNILERSTLQSLGLTRAICNTCLH